MTAPLRQDIFEEVIPPDNASFLTIYVHARPEVQAEMRRIIAPMMSEAAFNRWLLRTQPWSLIARTEQLEPPGDWFVWLFQAGRGAGKTRSGVEWVWKRANAWQNHIVHVVSPTVDDHDKVTFGGPSGLMQIVERNSKMIKKVSTQPWSIRLKNGAKILSFSAEAPERLRGPQAHSVLLDEAAGMGKKAAEVYTQASFGLRLMGPNREPPRMMITSTPKPLPLFIDLNRRAKEGDPSIVLTRASMMDNAINLSPEAIRELRLTYEGTRLGAQELYGALMTDVPGALWTAEMLQRASLPSRLDRVVVAVDPSGAADRNSSSDEIGIVVAGAVYGKTKHDDKFYVLADLSCIDSPNNWAAKAVQALVDWKGDRIIAETNFGGALVTATIRSVDANVPIRVVTASRGKVQRAEPIASIYEQGRAFHCGIFAKLEAQMTSMATNGYQGEGSPDRMDAMVWALTDLANRGAAPVVVVGGGTRVSNFMPARP